MTAARKTKILQNLAMENTSYNIKTGLVRIGDQLRPGRENRSSSRPMKNKRRFSCVA